MYSSLMLGFPHDLIRHGLKYGMVSDAFDRTCMSTSPDFKSLDEGYFGKQAPLRLLRSLAPGGFRRKHARKDQPNAVPSYPLGPPRFIHLAPPRFIHLAPPVFL